MGEGGEGEMKCEWVDPPGGKKGSDKTTGTRGGRVFKKRDSIKNKVHEQSDLHSVVVWLGPPRCCCTLDEM